MQKAIHSSEYKKILEKLRGARLRGGFSQGIVAEKLGKPQSYISKIERGERRIDIMELKQITAMYGVQISDIFEE
jgi:transcriptional regulator with XRE-family HTH domain